MADEKNNFFQVSKLGSIDLSIIMVSYNVKELICNSIRNIYQNTSGIDFEIICIDNNSTDKTLEMIKHQFPDVHLIINKKNMGFAYANNQGIQINKGRYIAFYNPDTLAVGNVFRELVKLLDKNPDIAAVGPKLLNKDGSNQISARNGYISLWNEFCFHSGASRFFNKYKLFGSYYNGVQDLSAVQEVDQVIAACLLCRNKVIKEIGGFDPKFPLYGEDVDLNYRIKKNGYKIIYYPFAKVYHIKGQSSKKNKEQTYLWILKGHNYFIRKHYGLLYSLLHKIIIFFIGIFWYFIWKLVYYFFIDKRRKIDDYGILIKFKIMIKWSLKIASSE